MTYREDIDRDLLNRMCRNEYRAFREIYDKYWLLLFDAAFRRLKNLHEAEEIVQDVFISLYQRRHELEIRQSLRAYLFAAVRYRVFNKFREWMQLEKTFKIKNIEDIEYEVSPAYLAEEKQMEDYLSFALNKLPPKCKEVFLLSRYSELTNKQVAEKLGISVNTVEKHIGRALQLLRKEMNKYHFGSYFGITILYQLMSNQL